MTSSPQVSRIPGCVCFNVTFEEAESVIPVTFEDECFCVTVDFGELMPITDFDWYEGPYIVIPKVYDQALETNRKVMRDDVTVLEIPYTESDNPEGGRTVTIAYL